eukprot:3199072-Prymnesium_polylepis.1
MSRCSPRPRRYRARRCLSARARQRPKEPYAESPRSSGCRTSAKRCTAASDNTRTRARAGRDANRVARAEMLAQRDDETSWTHGGPVNGQ